MTPRIRDVLISLFCIYILVLAFFFALSGPPIEMPKWVPFVLVALALLLAAVLVPAEYIKWRRHQSAAAAALSFPSHELDLLGALVMSPKGEISPLSRQLRGSTDRPGAPRRPHGPGDDENNDVGSDRRSPKTELLGGPLVRLARRLKRLVFFPGPQPR